MRIKKNWILLLLFVTGVVLADPAASHSPDSSELKQLDKKIQQLQHEIQNDQGKKGQLAEQFKTNSKKLAKLKQRQAVLQRELNKQQNALNELQKKQQMYQEQINQKKDQIEQQIVTTYKILLLSNEQGIMDPQRMQLDLLLNYYQYLDQGKFADFTQSIQTIAILGSESHETNNHKEAIQTLITRQQQPQKKLVVATQNQQQALNQLSTQIENKNQKLKQLVANRHALEQLIKSLQKQALKPAAREAKAAYSPQKSFAQAKAQLFWPVKGKIINQYGGSIEQSGLKYTGILIVPSNRATIQAVAPGRVIFANWLQGLGLLIILDHGDGYMSLYGHNQELYKKVGDTVQAQEVLGNLCKSGETHVSTLYFEVRHNGQPLNPLEWLLRN